MAVSTAAHSDPTDDEEYPEVSPQLEETVRNMCVFTNPYDDEYYIQDLEPFVRDDKEDFKRIVHGFLLANGQPWLCQELKNKIKETYEWGDIRDVDKFVEQHFKFKTFKEFIDKADDVATVEADGSLLPFLDDSNRDIYEDAKASLRNKEEKVAKKDAQIAATLDNPENVKEFYEGTNRLRQAIIKANEIHLDRDYAITKISAMDGTDKQVCGINVSHVQTEYQKMFGVALTDKECKKICGRSTLAKALNQGRPKCLIETIAMEQKPASSGVKQGMYIALKSTSHEYSQAEIEAAVEECRQKVSNVGKRMNQRDAREERKYDGVRRYAKVEMENLRSSNASPIASQTAPTATNVMHPDDDGEFDDSEDEANYSDDDEGNDAKRAKASEIKKKKEDKEKARQTTTVPSPAVASSPSAPPTARPSPPSAPLHDEVPYGQLPPAPYVLHYEDRDSTGDNSCDDALEAAAMAAMNQPAPPLPSRQSAPLSAPANKAFVQTANQWEEDEDHGEQSRPQPTPQPAVAPPPQAPPQPPPQQTSSIFGPRPITSDSNVHGQASPLQVQQQPVQAQQAPMPPPPPVQQEQPVQMHPNYGQPMQQPQHMPQSQSMMMQQPMAPSPQGGQFPPQYAPSPVQFPPTPPPMYQGNGMMAPPHQQMQQPYDQSGCWPGATPSQSQMELVGMPNQSQIHPQAPLPNPPLGMMPQQGPFSPIYYNNAPLQYGPGGPSPPPNHPANMGYQTPQFGTQSPIINVNVSLPPIHGQEIQNYNYPQQQANGQGPPPYGQGGHPQGHQGAGFPQGGAPQGHDYPPNQGHGHNGPSQGQFSPQGGGFTGRPQDGGYTTQGVNHHGGNRGGENQTTHQYQNRGGGGGGGGQGPPRRDDGGFGRDCVGGGGQGTRRDDGGFGRDCMRPYQEIGGHEGRRVEQPREPPLRPFPRHYAQEMRENRARDSARFENGFPRPTQTTKASNGQGVRDDGGGGGPRKDDRGFGRGCVEGGGGQGPRREDGGFGRDCMRRDEGSRRNDDGLGRDQRGGGNREMDRRVEALGRPQASSTPINRSPVNRARWEEMRHDTEWNEVIRMNTPKKRIRWLIICILKNVRDENYAQGLYKMGLNFEIVELGWLADLVMMGCGNDMELYEATAQYQDKPNPFLEFLKDMRDEGLIRLYTETTTAPHTIEHLTLTYIMDPYTAKPPGFLPFEDE